LRKEAADERVLIVLDDFLLILIAPVNFLEISQVEAANIVGVALVCNIEDDPVGHLLVGEVPDDVHGALLDLETLENELVGGHAGVALGVELHELEIVLVEDKALVGLNDPEVVDDHGELGLDKGVRRLLFLDFDLRLVLLLHLLIQFGLCFQVDAGEKEVDFGLEFLALRQSSPSVESLRLAYSLESMVLASGRE